MHEAAHGRDERPVVTYSEPQSISREPTFDQDLSAMSREHGDLKRELDELDLAVLSAKRADDRARIHLLMASRFLEERPLRDLVHGVAGLLRAQNASITFSARNLTLWTRFSGIDPESDYNQFGNLPSDFQTAPAPSYFTLRLNLGF